MADGGLSIHPMEQFKVKPLFGGDAITYLTITNVTLWLAITVACIVALFVLGTGKRAVVPGRVQSVAEMAYGLVYKLVEDVTGHDGVKYFPYVFTLFSFIVFSNFLGLIPGAFTTTSHIAVTAVLAIMVFLFVTILGFVKNGVSFLGLFWVSSAPLLVRPVLAIIELLSYLMRPVSHSIRLAANMLAGHTLLKILAGFAPVVLFSNAGYAVTPISVLGMLPVYALEVLVCFIQAYVFTILTCVYLRDALHPGH